MMTNYVKQALNIQVQQQQQQQQKLLNIKMKMVNFSTTTLPPTIEGST